MPSPRSSPAMRPTSPLSPRYETSRFEAMLQVPSNRGMQPRSPGQGQRKMANSLRLPSLPRFHPANFPSAHSSMQNTPDTVDTPHGPLSPRTHQRLYSDAQKQLYVYHRESLAAAAARAGSPAGDRPTSPRLAPLGSPGPVTPFELEAEGYITAGSQRAVAVSSQEVVNKLAAVEDSRRSGSGTTSSGTQRPGSRH